MGRKAQLPGEAQFAPALPRGVSEVFETYAIALRVVASNPEALPHVRHVLDTMLEALVPPEAMAARECHLCWEGFGTALGDDSTVERALDLAQRAYEALEHVGQKLDLPPSPDWDSWPETLVADTKHQISAGSQPSTETGPAEGLPTQALEDIRKQAKKRGKKLAKKETFPADFVTKLLLNIPVAKREGLLTRLVGEGVLGRGEAALVVRHLNQPSEVQKQDTTLADVLHRLGLWLAAD